MKHLQRPLTIHRAPRQDTMSAGSEHYVLRLYVAGAGLLSLRAVSNLKALCEQHLLGRYELEVVDLYQQPQLARDEQIVALPTLVKRLPPPVCRLIGDMSDTERILTGLGLLS